MSAVSVVMAVYNGQRFLPEQLGTLLADLEPGDEVIVVDDASTDGSVPLIEGFASLLIRLVRNETNLGARGSFERGLGLVRNEFVFLCDQDDIWCAGKRAAMLAAFDADPGVLLIVSDAQVIGPDGEVLAESFMDRRGGFRGGVAATLWRNRYLGCAMAFRRGLLQVALPIPARAPQHDMWLGILAAATARTAFLPRPLIRYRRHGGNVTPLKSHAGWLQLVRWRLDLLVALAGRLGSVRLGRQQA